MPRLWVRATRGDFVESEHAVAWTLARTGGPQADEAASLSIFARSAAKPFQALASVRAAVLERFGLGPRHLAVACASHGGHDEHVAAVMEILDAAGLGPEALACGEGTARDPAMAAEHTARGEPPSALRHNCSGKHALALALCVARGWPVSSYLDPGHPLQAAFLEEVAGALRVHRDAVPSATDGCGMRTFAVPLGGLAAAYARLASGGLGEPGDRAAEAMRAHPELVGFAGSIDTELMRAVPGAVAKIGAEGVLAAGLPDGRGLALKVADGAMRALGPAAVSLFAGELGQDVSAPALAGLGRPALQNAAGEKVGVLEAAPPPSGPAA